MGGATLSGRRANHTTMPPPLDLYESREVPRCDWRSHIEGPGSKEERKGKKAVTFLKKSNQKTFLLLGSGDVGTAHVKVTKKFFAELFFKKATSSFAYSLIIPYT